MRPLTSIELKALTYIEQVWHKEGRFPNSVELQSEVAEDFSLAESLQEPTFQTALDNRGISKRPFEVSGTKNSLSAEQLSTILAVSNYYDHRSFNGKLRSLGISATKWAGWMKEPAFKNYYTTLIDQNFEEASSIAQEGLMGAMQKGDTNAIKFYFELTGKFKSESQDIVNVKLLLSRLIEIIQIRVPDESTKRLIADDFHRVVNGGPVYIVAELEAGI